MKLTDQGSYDPPAKIIRKSNQKEYWLVEWDSKIVLYLSYHRYGRVKHYTPRITFESRFKWPFSQAK